MRHLRHLSARPELVTDERARALIDNTDRSRLGRNAPFGRERVVDALPLKDGPQIVKPQRLVRDHEHAFLADPDGNVIGHPQVVIHRLVAARWVQDTRRLAG